MRLKVRNYNRNVIVQRVWLYAELSLEWWQSSFCRCFSSLSLSLSLLPSLFRPASSAEDAFAVAFLRAPFRRRSTSLRLNNWKKSMSFIEVGLVETGRFFILSLKLFSFCIVSVFWFWFWFSQFVFSGEVCFLTVPRFCVSSRRLFLTPCCFAP